MAENPELEAAILANLSDRRGYLVYADWLQAHDDPRGQLIALQYARMHHRSSEPPGSDGARRDELRAAERALFDAHLHEWVGPLAERIGLSWRCGFVDDLRCDVSDLETKETPSLGELTELLRRPVFRLLRYLNVRLVYLHHPQTAFSGLSFPSVTGLSIIGPLQSKEGRLRIAHLAQAFPALEHLKLGMPEAVDLQGLSFPNLRLLEIAGVPVTADVARWLFNAQWPRLKTVMLSFLSQQDGGGLRVEDFAPLLTASGFPRLRKLHLNNPPLGAEFREALSSSFLARQLTSCVVRPPLERERPI